MNDHLAALDGQISILCHNTLFLLEMVWACFDGAFKSLPIEHNRDDFIGQNEGGVGKVKVVLVVYYLGHICRCCLDHINFLLKTFLLTIFSKIPTKHPNSSISLKN